MAPPSRPPMRRPPMDTAPLRVADDDEPTVVEPPRPATRRPPPPPRKPGTLPPPQQAATPRLGPPARSVPPPHHNAQALIPTIPPAHPGPPEAQVRSQTPLPWELPTPHHPLSEPASPVYEPRPAPAAYEPQSTTPPMAGPEQQPTSPPQPNPGQMMTVPPGPMQFRDPNATQSVTMQTGIGGRMLAMWIGGAALVGLLVSVVGALVLGPNDAGPPAASASKASASPPARVTSRPAAPPVKAPEKSSEVLSLEDRAAAGDSEAMRLVEVQSLTERKASQIVALAKGRSAQKRAAMEVVARELRSNLPLSADRDTLAKLRPFIQDRETATEALAVLASLRSPLAGDLLYEIWTTTRGKTETSELARELLYTKEVKDSVSEALSVALDLREARTCEEVDKLLPRAREHGDTRSLTLLGKLNFRYGCGSRGGQDCYPCLRGTTAISDAIQAVRGRPAPGI